MILGQWIVLCLFVDLATVFVSIESHEHMLINLCIFQELVFQNRCVALESLKKLAGLLLFISFH